MKPVRFVLIACALATVTVALAAQDPLKVAAGNYKLLVENAAVRIMQVNYPAGAKSVMHSHPDVIAVVLQGGRMRFTDAKGVNTDSDMANDSAVYMAATSHSNTNLGSTAMSVVLVEFRTPAPGKAVIPTSRPGLATKTLAEGPRAIAYTVTADATFAEPAGTTHDYDQIVIALGPAQMSLSLAGKPAKTTWARGDVQWIGRGTPHEAKNTGGKPVSFAIVAIR